MNYALLAVIVGALTSIQSRANGALDLKLGNNFASALTSQIIAWAFLLPVLLISQKNRAGIKKSWKAIRGAELKKWELAGGFIGGSFLSIQSYAVPVIGVALFTIATVAGQTTTSLLIDKFGIGPAGKKAITMMRIFCATLTIVAVGISVIPDLRGTHISWLPLILALAIGSLLSLQQAINGRVTFYLKDPMATTFYNFLFGTLVITVGLMISLFHNSHIGALPHNPLYYIGGPCGLIFISVSAVIIRHLGVLNYILYSVLGTLVGAILLDWITPAHKGALTGYLVLGTIVTFLAIVFLRFSESKSNAAS
jgi:bacterial/archaeal transporter family-2 protein